MTIEVTDLKTLSVADVAAQEDALALQLGELAPHLDLRAGALRQLLLHFEAILTTKNQTEIDRLRQSFSLAAIVEDPTLADDATVDALVSNFRVTRKPGAAAHGPVTLVFSTNDDVTIAAGSTFVAGEVTFTVDALVTGRGEPADILTDTDRWLVPRQDGRYELQVLVTAAEPGVVGALSKDVLLTPTLPPPNFVQAFTAADFVGGIDRETSRDLAQRCLYGLASRSLTSRLQMSSWLREQFPDVAADSVVGFGDPEMRRDRRSIVPVAHGGRVDWYVQTQPLYREVTVAKAATLVTRHPDGTTVWQLSFSREEFPGFYDVRVLPGAAGEYAGDLPVTSDLRGMDLTPLSSADDYVPDIAQASEAAFSCYQTAVIQFLEMRLEYAGLPLGTQRDVNVTVRHMPQLKDIQQYFSAKDRRSLAADVLVKAPLPCYVSLSLRVFHDLDTPPDSLEMQQALADLVNTQYAFTGSLSISPLLEVAHDYLSRRSFIRDWTLRGRLLSPDGTWQQLHHAEQLVIPSQPSKMLGPRTVAFFLRPADVTLELARL